MRELMVVRALEDGPAPLRSVRLLANAGVTKHDVGGIDRGGDNPNSHLMVAGCADSPCDDFNEIVAAKSALADGLA